MAEAALSFLGLGLPITQPSLGTLIRSGYDLIFAGIWWVTVLPGLTLVGVLIGDFLSPMAEISAVVGALSGIPVSGHLLQVLDPAEALLPYAGRVRFRGMEKEADAVVPRVEGIRSGYAVALAEQQRALAAACSAAGWTFGLHRTDHPPEAALLGLYTALSAK